MLGLGLSAPAAGADWSGTWAARTADRTYEIVSIGRAAEADGRWRVTITRPKASRLYEDGMVGHLSGELETLVHLAWPASGGLVMAESPEVGAECSMNGWRCWTGICC